MWIYLLIESQTSSFNLLQSWILENTFFVLRKAAVLEIFLVFFSLTLGEHWEENKCWKRNTNKRY